MKETESHLQEKNSALLIIDMINDLNFEAGEELLESALPAARCVAALKTRVQNAGQPVIYANDNFGKWKSDFRGQVERCLRKGVRGRPIVELLQPEAADYFVLKPKHSAFYGTTLNILLQHLNIRNLILTGIATDICVLFTANDAYMRDYHLCIPADCVAANNQQCSTDALVFMQRVLKADIRTSTELKF